MAATLTITSPEPGGMGKYGEWFTENIKIVGSTSAAADTGTLTPKFVVPVGILGGNFSVSYTSGVATITANAAQASTTTYATMFGYAK